MNNKEILEKAMQKAIDCGWDFYGDLPLINRWSCNPEDADLAVMLEYKTNGYREETWHLNKLIFNKSFSKSLWGENMVDTNTTVVDEYDNVIYMKKYEYHLQRMVIASDPIKYLGEHLND